MDTYIKFFDRTGIADIPVVGGKNASLGEMYNRLSSQGIAVPYGFATTAPAFRLFLMENGLDHKLRELLHTLDRENYTNLRDIGSRARQYILEAAFPEKLSDAIIEAYSGLCERETAEVAVRSSATAEDLPEASFAGMHDTFLNIKGEKNVLKAAKRCFASLYTDRAIKYREDKGFKHEEVALSVGIQKMVRADKGCSGVGFTVDPESGFDRVVLLSGVWGLGENMVQGTVNPDDFYVFKPALKKGYNAIIRKELGSKDKTMIYTDTDHHVATINTDTPKDKQETFVLSDEEIHRLARWAVIIEEHYGKPMDIEWAKDGLTHQLFIIQARPETVHRSDTGTFFREYHISGKGKTLTSGNAIGHKIVHGTVRLLPSPADAGKLSAGDIIVTGSITPDWDPLLKSVSAIVTNKGGRTSHAAIVSRELGIPAIVGCMDATRVLTEGAKVTISCAEGNTGYVYEDEIPFTAKDIDLSRIKMPKTEAKLILSDPGTAFRLAAYPHKGVGLLRMEFIITHQIKIHPMALVDSGKITDKATRTSIEELTRGYKRKEAYFIDRLAQGIATICAAFYPEEVIVRLSDFKSNEYANLIGGQYFEPVEENPMLGFRGASRYYNEAYREAFKLECEAIRKVRSEMGFHHLKVMVPFCRTPEEGRNVIRLMAENGLAQGKEDLEIYTMIEIPSNVILAEEFARIFDGFSIGSNDLTQLVLGIDRDSELVSNLFDENNRAVKMMITSVIGAAQKAGIKTGLCGQAPSDFPEFAAFLVESGIDSISFNPDALLTGIENMRKAEDHILRVSSGQP
ncbi:phosphoenolpyruvate synthase [Sinomicrobium pectinilyticum]|uniref:Phosphoenolpyruvate synthase n=1 Tax=Sinomicrobium pectinilyticum TaxID=1084421 RepID=A0A3N0DI01_SINP1|nr:phosphoenolpyruvate synthase [Sinomicrobium pectinilyticum]RNL75300.1 phosphoenolpyruvate synthase [Sinomicrobium pectinilyticum]